MKADELDTTEGMDSALKVIELIPRNQDQDAVWHSLEGSLCEHEDVAVMKIPSSPAPRSGEGH